MIKMPGPTTTATTLLTVRKEASHLSISSNSSSTSLKKKRVLTTSKSPRSRATSTRLPNFWPSDTPSQPEEALPPPINDLVEEEEEQDWMEVLKGQRSETVTPQRIDLVPPNFADFDQDQDEDFLTNFSARRRRDVFTAASTTSSNNTASIGWADDAVECETTSAMAKRWADVEEVFNDTTIIPPQKPPDMSSALFEEVLMWKEAFGSKTKQPYNDFKCYVLPPKKDKDEPLVLEEDHSYKSVSNSNNFVQAWVANLTAEVEATRLEEEPSSQAVTSSSSSFLRVQRPISSHYLNRKLPTIRSHASTSVFGHQQPQSRINSASTSRNPPSQQWSRFSTQTKVFEEEESSDLMSMSMPPVESSRPVSSKNFVNWLLFDEKEEEDEGH